MKAEAFEWFLMTDGGFFFNAVEEAAAPPVLLSVLPAAGLDQ